MRPLSRWRLEPSSEKGLKKKIALKNHERQEPAACRTYDYMGEAACDARMMTFLTCVRAVRDQTPGGFAAVKLTALGDPVLLAQIATCAHVSFHFFYFLFLLFEGVSLVLRVCQ